MRQRSRAMVYNCKLNREPIVLAYGSARPLRAIKAKHTVTWSQQRQILQFESGASTKFGASAKSKVAPLSVVTAIFHCCSNKMGGWGRGF